MTLLSREGGAGSAIAEAPAAGTGRPRSSGTQSVKHETGSGELSTDPQAPELEEILITGNRRATGFDLCQRDIRI